MNTTPSYSSFGHLVIFLLSEFRKTYPHATFDNPYIMCTEWQETYPKRIPLNSNFISNWVDILETIHF
jgi:hypothetical protein